MNRFKHNNADFMLYTSLKNYQDFLWQRFDQIKKHDNSLATQRGRFGNLIIEEEF